MSNDRVPVRLHSVDKPESIKETLWTLAEEVPVALLYNSTPHVVMMTTPRDLEDFGLGFSLSEGLIRQRKDITNMVMGRSDMGITVDMAVVKEAPVVHGRIQRNLAGATGCGLCGVETLQQAVRPPPHVQANFDWTVKAILRAVTELPDQQPLNHRARTLHAAAWCDPDGNIMMVREDVGRHNALDKLIGGLAQQKVDFSNGFVVMSSRCSYELVQKAAAMGIPALATLSAPTTLALWLAQRAGLRLATVNRNQVAFPEGTMGRA